MYFLTLKDIQLIHEFTGKSIILEFSHVECEYMCYDGYRMIEWWDNDCVYDYDKYFYIRLHEVALLNDDTLLLLLRTIKELNYNNYIKSGGLHPSMIDEPKDVIENVELRGVAPYNYACPICNKGYTTILDEAFPKVYRDKDGVVVVTSTPLRGIKRLCDVAKQLNNNVDTAYIKEFSNLSLVGGHAIGVIMSGIYTPLKYLISKWYIDYLHDCGRLQHSDTYDNLKLQYTMGCIAGEYTREEQSTPYLSYSKIDATLKEEGVGAIYNDFVGSTKKDDGYEGGSVNVVDTPWGIVGVVKDEGSVIVHAQDLSINNRLHLETYYGIVSIEVIYDLGVVIKSGMLASINTEVASIAPPFQVFNMANYTIEGNLVKFKIENDIVFMEASVLPHCIVPLQVRDWMANAEGDRKFLSNLLDNKNYSGLSLYDSFNKEGEYDLY